MDELYCIGCGALLQVDDEAKEGYVEKKALDREHVLCKRCFQLKHYGKFLKMDNIIDPLDILNKQAKKNDLIIILMDSCQIYSPSNQDFKKIKKYPNKIIIFNRFDLINDFINKAKLKENLKKEYAFLNPDKIYILEDNIQEIFEYIDNHTINNNAYLIGNENVGKTTFVNLILKKVGDEKENFLLSSYFPGTTLKQIQIPLTDNTFLIDLPGLKRTTSFLTKVENKVLKSIVTSKKIHSYSYQLKEKQAFLIHNYMIFESLNDSNCSIVFYIPNQLKIARCKIENALNNFKKMTHNTILTTKNIEKLNDYEFIVKNDEPTDIVVEGLLFIRVFKRGKYLVKSFDNLNVFQRKSIF